MVCQSSKGSAAEKKVEKQETVQGDNKQQSEEQ